MSSFKDLRTRDSMGLFAFRGICSGDQTRRSWRWVAAASPVGAIASRRRETSALRFSVAGEIPKRALPVGDSTGCPANAARPVHYGVLAQVRLHADHFALKAFRRRDRAGGSSRGARDGSCVELRHLPGGTALRRDRALFREEVPEIDDVRCWMRGRHESVELQ